jgi:hypothetical protein
VRELYLGDWYTRMLAFQCGQFLGACINQVSDLAQNTGAFAGGQAWPRAVVKGMTGGYDGSIDFLGIRLQQDGHRLFGCGIYHRYFDLPTPRHRLGVDPACDDGQGRIDHSDILEV